jgi:hypothetical protein
MYRNRSDNTYENLLAKSLANNHVSSCLGPHKDHSRLLKEHSQIRGYDRRIIVIVGSGVSQDAGLWGTKRLIAELRKPGFPLSEEVIEKELDRLESVQKLDRSQFETLLLAMSATEHSGKVVREKLVEIYNRRYKPTLPYEILAHLLKHKFVDAIISFNFDELLDQAISDELNPGEYHFILSDGDSPSTPLPQGKGVLQKPFYIKPHGTASHSSTLRFTRDDYFRLPIGIQRIIKELLSARPVDLISIGFDMKSFEFNHILRGAVPESRIFYINLYEPEPDIPFEDNIKSHLIRVGDKSRALSKVLGDILDKTYKHFWQSYTPRDIYRHRLLATLFEGEKPDVEDISTYLWDRTVIELALAIAKAKGFVTMSGLSAGRTGKYFRKYQSFPTSQERLFKDLCAAIGLRDVAYGHDALRLTKNDRRPEILSEDEFNDTLDSFVDDVRTLLKPARRWAFDTHRHKFKDTLLMHYKGEEVEIRAAPEILHANLFQAPQVIRSKTALDCQTVELLENRHWRWLLLVSETGEWLTHPRIKKVIDIKRHVRRKIYLIVADESHKKNLLRAYPKQIVVKRMAWWDHNRHLSLFLDKNKNEMCSIYFTRQRRATDIVPVLLDESDSRIVFEFWKAYWIRVTEPGVWIDRKKIEDFKFPPDDV